MNSRTAFWPPEPKEQLILTSPRVGRGRPATMSSDPLFGDPDKDVINWRLIENYWDDMLRLAGSLHSGTIKASEGRRINLGGAFRGWADRRVRWSSRGGVGCEDRGDGVVQKVPVTGGDHLPCGMAVSPLPAVLP